MNSIGNSMNPVSLIFGGYCLMNVKVDSVFSMLNEMDIQINGASDSGTFDITKMLIKFPNTRSFVMTANENTGRNLATLQFSHPFYDTLKVFGLIRFMDVTGFLNLRKQFLPEGLNELYLDNCGITDDQIGSDDL